MYNPQIILASQSPSRKSAMGFLGIDFECHPQDIDETPFPDEKPRVYVKRLALEKALSAQQHHPDALIIAADTIGYKSHTILQKPSSPQDAFDMISKLSNSRHRILTGMCILHKTRKSLSVSVTRVQFRKLTPLAIRNYVESNEWQGFSAGYSTSNRAFTFIKSINGSLSTITGLPMARLANTLSSFGVKHDI